MKRDPRVAPYPGDVLRARKETREVKSIELRADGQVWRITTFVRESGRAHPWMGYPLIAHIAQWRKWAASAEVLNAAD